MLRMVRARQGDPAIARDPCKSYYGRDKPDLEVDYMRLSPERLAEAQRSLARTSLNVNCKELFIKAISCICTM